MTPPPPHKNITELGENMTEKLLKTDSYLARGVPAKPSPQGSHQYKAPSNIKASPTSTYS